MCTGTTSINECIITLLPLYTERTLGVGGVLSLSKAKGSLDKNLSNVIDDLAETPVNAHHAQQLQQDVNDRRHQDEINHDQPVDMNHQRS